MSEVDEAMVEAVADAIDAVEPAFTRRDEKWEVCRHTHPTIVRPEVIATFNSSQEADEFRAEWTSKERARAAIRAMREAEGAARP